MNEDAKLILTLVIISVVSAAALSYTYLLTKDKIEENKLGGLRSSLKEVMPEADSFEEVKIEGIEKAEAIYSAFDQNRNKVGFVLLAKKRGYQSDIKVLIGIDAASKTIKKINILEQIETPGLGTRVAEEGFTGQFSNQPLESQEVDAITGATISSSAVIEGVKESSAELLKLMEEGRI